MSMTISKETRQPVRELAKYLCEYCHSSEEASAARFEIDHIQPRSPIRQRLRAAYRRGQAAHWDVDTWQPETLWTLPLTQVQAQFQV